MTRKEKLIKLFEHDDIKTKRTKLQEEIMELQDELYQVFEMGVESDNLLGEVADVLSLVLQFAYAYGYPTEVIIEMLDYKINRQLKRNFEISQKRVDFTQK